MNHWEYLLTGSPFQQISDAEHSANPGDIVVSPDVWFEAGDMFEGEPVPNTNCHLLKSQKASLLPLPLEKPFHLWIEHGQTMVSLIEPSVVDQLRELHGSWTRVGQSPDSTLRRLSKHDDCSTIFILIKEEVNDIKFADSNLDKMQKAFIACYQPLQRYGGMLRQFLMDDKGMVAILVFTGKVRQSEERSDELTTLAIGTKLKLLRNHRYNPHPLSQPILRFASLITGVQRHLRLQVRP